MKQNCIQEGCGVISNRQTRVMGRFSQYSQARNLSL